jgi:hypothetical protein
VKDNGIPVLLAPYGVKEELIGGVPRLVAMGPDERPALSEHEARSDMPSDGETSLLLQKVEYSRDGVKPSARPFWGTKDNYRR